MNQSGYFASRTAVGQRFAEELASLRYENTAILALSTGGVVIAVEIAKKLHSLAGLLLLKHVYLPDGRTAIGVVNDQGGFTHDESIAAAQFEEFEIEYRNAIEANKLQALHELHTVGHAGVVDPHYFSGRQVILVTDFAKTGTAYKAALDFLKPVRTEKIILVAAVAQLPAIDIMHQIGDKILVAHATDKTFPAEHYFTDNTIPTSTELLQMMDQILLQW